MISIIITAYKEPNTIGRAISAIVEQKINYKYELLVACPDIETARVVKRYEAMYPQVKHVQDPGKGKSYALNMLLNIAEGDIMIFTDGDIWVGQNAINKIMEPFKNSQVGIACGRPMAADPRNKMFGYWAHLLLDAGAHRARMRRAKKGEFFETSAYLFAFRKGVIDRIPLDVAEDAVIPYLFFKKGYKIAYAPNAHVYIKYPTNFKDWIKQKVRTAKAHETLDRHVDTSVAPRTKSFTNEVKEGTLAAISYPRNLREFIWTLLLFPARLLLWAMVFKDTRLTQKHYTDAWERVESTK